MTEAARARAIDLSVVVPAYNEAANIEPVVAEIRHVMEENPWAGDYEIILVNDGSQDGTGRVMERLAERYQEVVACHHSRNRGFGAALRTGFDRSRGRYVTLITGDGQVPMEQPLQLLREIGNHDLMLTGRERRVTAVRTFLTWGVNTLVRLILGAWHDQALGIYVVRGDVLRALPLHSESGVANLELLLQCRSRGHSIGVSGVTRVRPRLSGRSKVTNLRTSLQILWEIVKLRWRLERQRASEGRH